MFEAGAGSSNVTERGGAKDEVAGYAQIYVVMPTIKSQGVLPLIPACMKSQSLNVMRYTNGSQCSDFIASLTLSRTLRPTTSR